MDKKGIWVVRILTSDIEISAMNYFEPRKNIIVPNITHISGLVMFETDILVLSNSGYAIGMEIKISKSDLKADLKKSQWKNIDNPNEFRRWFDRFKYFYYGVPHYLTEAAFQQIPEWCGLIEYKKNKEETYTYGNCVRLPQQIFRTKWTDKEVLKLAKLGTLRIPNLKYKINQYVHLTKTNKL